MSETSAGRLAFAGLLALLVVDALLVVLAFRPDAAGAASETPTPVAAVVATSPTTSAAPVIQPAPLREVIAAVDGKRAWRSTVGSCRDGGATLSATDDGGRTWTTRDTPARALGRIQPVGSDRGFVIGVRSGCSAAEFDTDDDAKSWTRPSDVEGGWSRVPGGDKPTLAITPERPDARPCGSTNLIDLARVSATRAVAACADGRLVRSTDGGARWSTLATVKGTLTIATRDEKDTAVAYVARVTDGCAGIEVAKVSDGAASRVACVTTPLTDVEGRVSLSVVNGAGWLAVAGDTWRSGGNLKTWSAAS